MKATPPCYRLFPLLLATGFSLFAVNAKAADGTWNNIAGGAWNVDTNWLSDIIADGNTSTAFFNAIDLVADTAVTLGADRTIQNLTFGNLTPGNNYSWAVSGNTLTLDGTTPTITVNDLGAGAVTIGSIVAGTVGLTKAGTGTLVLSGANSFTGNVNLSNGTLRLAGGNNRLPTAGTFTFGGGTTLDLGGNSQTLGTLSTPGVATTTTFTATNGSLTVSAGSMVVRPSGTTNGVSNTLDLSGLSQFVYNNASGNIQMGGSSTGSSTQVLSGNIKLSLISNTLTAASVQVGAFNGNSGGATQKATLTLGAANQIWASNFLVGAGSGAATAVRADGDVVFAAGLTNPTFTLRGVAGGTTRSAIIIASSTAGGNNGTSTLNLNGATVDIMASTLLIGRFNPGGGTSIITGSLLFNGGTVDATTITLGQRSGDGSGRGSGLINQGGGTMKVATLTLGDSGAGAAGTRVTGEYILGGGSLYATTIQAGTNLNTNGSTVRRITWNDGTIRNYDASTNLTINGVANGIGPLGIVLASTGTHTFFADTSRSITVNSNVIISGTGGTLVKDGAGTLNLLAANTYTGTTTLNAGILQAGNDSAFGTGTLALNSGTLSSNSTAGRTLANAVTFGGNVTLGDATNNGLLTFNGAGTLTGNRTLTTASNVTYANAIGGGSNGLTKAGSGDLTFTAANTYTGATIVTGGTLILSGGGSVASNVIQVQSGATLNTAAVSGGFQLQSGQTLQNKGTFVGSLTALSGSTYAPGNSPGIATQNGDLALNTGSNFQWELIANTDSDAGINFDQTEFTSGGLTIQTGVTANLVFNAASTVLWSDGFWSSNQQWLVFTGADSLTAAAPGIFTSISVGVDSGGFTLAPSQGIFSFTNVGNDVYLNYTLGVIPEPSTTLLLAGALTALVVFRRRRRV